MQAASARLPKVNPMSKASDGRAMRAPSLYTCAQNPLNARKRKLTLAIILDSMILRSLALILASALIRNLL